MDLAIRKAHTQNGFNRNVKPQSFTAFKITKQIR